ncbi:DUF1349 domain-containing protein [Oligoflexia bacterium]|nr:DUF1349 domain-containing protein [Oligoflexia bacterium]
MFEEFVAQNCKYFKVNDDKISLACSAGQDDFNIPTLHSVSNIAYIGRDVVENFTFQASCQLHGTAKFDAAGIYLIIGGCRVKFGIENYGESNYRIVAVRTTSLSDESSGSIIDSSSIDLIATRESGIFSFYSKCDSKIRFERAFAIDSNISTIKAGLFVQSPFSENGACADYKNISLTDQAFGHVRS